MGFCLSLFFEITQLTGLYGIYEHPYRLFDVDDLIQNTSGAMLGFWIMGPFVKVLPTMASINEHAYVKGVRPSFIRRVVSLILDVVILMVTSAATKLVVSLLGFQDLDTLLTLEGFFSFPLVEVFLFLLLFVAVPTVTKGQTLGQKVFKLIMAKPDAEAASWYNYLARYVSLPVIVYLGVVLPTTITSIDEATASGLGTVGNFLLRHQGEIALVWLISVAAWLIFMLIRNHRSKRTLKPFVLLNELVSNTSIFTLRQLEEIHESSTKLTGWQPLDPAKYHRQK